MGLMTRFCVCVHACVHAHCKNCWVASIIIGLPHAVASSDAWEGHQVTESRDDN